MRRVQSIGWLFLAVFWTGCADPVSPNPMFAPLAAVVDPTPNPVQIYGAWHCSNDYCTWGAERTLTEFDNMNRWLVDRGDGRPSVNLVVLSFVHPYRLLRKTTDAQTVNGIPRGMTPAVINYFKGETAGMLGFMFWDGRRGYRVRRFDPDARPARGLIVRGRSW